MLNSAWMRTLLAPVAVIGMFLSGSLHAANPFSTSGWVKVESPDGAFIVMMPGAPQLATATENDDSGPVQMHKYVFEAGNEAYGVSYRDYTTPLDPKSALPQVRNGLVGNGKVIVESEVTAAGHPGKMVSWNRDGKTWVAVAVVSGSRLYQVIYYGTGMQALTHGTAFEKSFQLTR